MGRILFIIFSVLLIQKIVRRRIDFYSIAGVCLIIYNIYCAVGTVWITSHDSVNYKYFYSQISMEVYTIVLIEMALLYVAIICHDKKKPNVIITTQENYEYSERVLERIFFCSGIISVLIMVVNIISIGPSNLTADKSEVWAQTNMLYVTGLWIAMAVFSYSAKKKKRNLLFLSVPQIFIHLFIGSRAYVAVIAIVFLIYFGRNLKKSFRANFKLYIIGAILLLLIMLYKQIWLDVKAGDLAGIIQTLKTPDTYAWIFRWGEPRIVLSNLQYIISNEIKLNAEEVIARFISIIPFAREFIFDSSVNYLMSSIIRVNLSSSYGVASNIWGECYSMFSYWFIFAFYIMWLLSLEYGNRIINKDNWTSYFLIPLISYCAFYIHRMDIAKLFGNIKMCLFGMCIWLIVRCIITKRTTICIRRKSTHKIYL